MTGENDQAQRRPRAWFDGWARQVGVAALVGALLLLAGPVFMNTGVLSEASGDTGPLFCGFTWWRVDPGCPGCCSIARVYSERLSVVVGVLSAGFLLLLADVTWSWWQQRRH